MDGTPGRICFPRPSLALIVVTAWEVWTGRGVLPAADAGLVHVSLHVVRHVNHLGGLDGLDQAGLRECRMRTTTARLPELTFS